MLDFIQLILSCRYEEKLSKFLGDVLSPATPTLSLSLLCSTIVLYDKCALGLVLPIVNKRGECLMPYSPVIDDCAEVKWLLVCVTYRLASIFSHLTTKAIPDTRACVQPDVQVHHEEHRSVA